MDDEDAIGILLIILIAAGVLLFVGLAWIGSFYIGDRAVEATITDKSCDTPPGASSTVTVVTQFPIPGIEHTIPDFDDLQCHGLGEGNYVEYHVRSGRTILYESEGGACIWDSEEGLGC